MNKVSPFQRGPVGLLSMLPQEFIREQVQELRIAEGMKPNPTEMLKKWIQRGKVVYDSGTMVRVKAGTGDRDS